MKFAIDPGHGMSNASPGTYDPGAVANVGGTTFQEADIALRYGLALRDKLRAKGHEVFMTRDDATDVAPVTQRAGNAEAAGCDVFLSLHLNSFDSSAANGVEVLYRDDADIAYAAAMRKAVLDASGLKRRDNKKRTELAVLKFDGPAVLIELGFITNDQDRKTLLNPQVRDDICANVTAALLQMFAAGLAMGDVAVLRQRLAASDYALPSYARTKIGGNADSLWSAASPISGMNFYSGLVRSSCHKLPSSAALPTGAIYYEAKFAIDGDGSGGNDEDDPAFQHDTSLHDANNDPLNSRDYPFIVLPLRHNIPDRPQWKDLGVGLGDLGMCVFKNGRSVAVLFGDQGPAKKLGEGSMFAAKALGINPDPNIGGIGPDEVPPGVCHFVFPGSRKLKPGTGTPRTLDTPQSVKQRAEALFAAMVNSAGAGTGLMAGLATSAKLWTSLQKPPKNSEITAAMAAGVTHFDFDVAEPGGRTAAKFARSMGAKVTAYNIGAGGGEIWNEMERDFAQKEHREALRDELAGIADVADYVHIDNLSEVSAEVLEQVLDVAKAVGRTAIAKNNPEAWVEVLATRPDLRPPYVVIENMVSQQASTKAARKLAVEHGLPVFLMEFAVEIDDTAGSTVNDCRAFAQANPWVSCIFHMPDEEEYDARASAGCTFILPPGANLAVPAQPRVTVSSGGSASQSMIAQSVAAKGQAKVIVSLKPGVANGAGLGADLAGLAAHFVAPDKDQDTALAKAAKRESGPKGRIHETSRRLRVYPHLGIALGYVDSSGLSALSQDNRVGSLVPAPEISLIKPVGGRDAQLAKQIAWGVDAMRVPKLWSAGYKGSGVLVGHLDTGIDASHPALASAVLTFAEFDMSGDQVINAEPRDSAWHGTHTAGTIAGRPVGNAAFGVAPEAKLASGLVIEGGQVIDRILAGMDWVVSKQARILSLSLGLRGFTPAFEVVINALRERNVLPVVAVGNEGPDTSRSPGNYPDVLSVGALDANRTVADFSGSERFNRPGDPLVPDLVAPGVAILSCVPGNRYRESDGTSMATPHVAGLAALLLSAVATASTSEIEAAIRGSCSPIAPSARANLGLPDAVKALAILSHGEIALDGAKASARTKRMPAKKKPTKSRRKVAVVIAGKSAGRPAAARYGSRGNGRT